MANLQSFHYNYVMLLINPVDIVRLSFLAQRSISYLDLSTCELTRECQSVFTNEGLIKHLDKFSGNIQDILSVQKYFHISLETTVNAYVSEEVYTQHLANDIVNHIHKSNQKQKEWLRFLRPMFTIQLFQEYHSWKTIFECSIEIFFNDSQNSSLILEIVIPEYFVEWTLTTSKPKVLDFVLRHFDSKKIVIWTSNYWDGSSTYTDPINGCLTFGQMDHVAVLLKYRNAPDRCLNGFIKTMYKLIQVELPFFSEDVFIKNMTKSYYMINTRISLVIQTIFVYCYIRKHIRFLFKSIHALRLIWRSLPDAYLSYEELVSPFAEDDSEECMLTKRNLLMMYSTDIVANEGGKLKCFDPFLRSQLQPRTLAHYCRTRIRSTMFENYSLSTGIGTLDIPNELKSFLRLEC